MIGRVVAIGCALLVAAPVAAQAAALSSPMAADQSERLSLARSVAAKLLPPGVYKSVMATAMEPVIGSLGDSMKAIPLRQIAAMGGLNEKDAAALDKVDVTEVMAITDPHWRERTDLTMRAMFASMGDFFTTLEPQLREAYAQAYARRFTLDELKALDQFFATPAGAKYAAQYMTIASDPAIAAEMKATMPKMMAQMPTFMAAAQKATAALPPARTYKDLTPVERARLAKALGVPEAQLKDAKQ